MCNSSDSGLTRRAAHKRVIYHRDEDSILHISLATEEEVTCSCCQSSHKVYLNSVLCFSSKLENMSHGNMSTLQKTKVSQKVDQE